MTNINNPHTSVVCVKQAEYFGHFSFRIRNRQWYETFKLKHTHTHTQMIKLKTWQSENEMILKLCFLTSHSKWRFAKGQGHGKYAKLLPFIGISAHNRI